MLKYKVGKLGCVSVGLENYILGYKNIVIFEITKKLKSFCRRLKLNEQR